MSEKKKRKPLRETKVGQLLANSGLINNLLDVVPDKGVLGLVKNILKKDNTLPPVDKEQALKLLEMDLAEMEAVTRRWEADAQSGSWLSQNVRPMALIFMLLVYAAGFFMKYELDLPTQLLMLMVGAYFGGRSFEKTRK
jgi:hypothetical protein|tara:strand:+ start:2399 stop:2815 length:417 start_codon:yes stop_codon:yes gene_type:complete